MSDDLKNSSVPEGQDEPDGLAQNAVSRRQFLKVAALAGAAVGLGGTLGGLLGACGGEEKTTTSVAATTSSTAAQTTSTAAESTTTVSVSSEPVKIGALFTLTTGISLLAQEQQRGYTVALDSVGGKVQGRPVQIEYTDVTSVDSMVSEAQRLIQAGARVLIPSGADALDTALVPIAEQFKVPLYMTLGVGDNFTNPGSDYLFRTNPWASLEGKWMAEWCVAEIIPALKLDPSKIMVGSIHTDDSMGVKNAETSQAILTAAGAKIAVNEGFNEDSIKDFSPIVLKAKNAGVNLNLGTFGPSEGKLFWEAAKRYDYNPLAAIGTGGFEGNAAAQSVLGDKGCDGLLSSNWPGENTNAAVAPDIDKFMAGYRSTFNAEHIQTVHSFSGYTGMLFLLDALNRATNLDDPESVRQAIIATDIPEKTIGNGWGCKFSTRQQPYEGGFVGQNIRGFLVGMQWQEGSLYTLSPVAYANKSLRLPMKSWAEKGV